MEQLIALTDPDDEADERMALSEVLSFYNRIVGEMGNPSANLLEAMANAGDTSKVLLEGMSQNHESAVQNGSRIDMLEANQGDIDELTGPDGAVTVNTANIATNRPTSTPTLRTLQRTGSISTPTPPRSP